jgi:hypothetical protein
MTPLTIQLYRDIRPLLPPEAAREILTSPRARSLNEWCSTLTLFVPHGDVATAVLDSISRWCLTQNDAKLVLQELTKIDRRLTVWCACACAATALRFVQATEHRPNTAIETARAWVRRTASIDDCRMAGFYASAAYAVNTSTDPAAAFAAWAAAYCANTAASDTDAKAASDAATAAHAAAAAPAYSVAASTVAVRTESISALLHSLCTVIANAVVSLPRVAL